MRCISSRGRAAGRGEGAPGVPEIVEVDVTEAGRVEGTEPDPAEVVAAEDPTAGAHEDEPGSAGGGVLGQVVNQLREERSREDDGTPAALLGALTVRPSLRVSAYERRTDTVRASRSMSRRWSAASSPKRSAVKAARRIRVRQ